VGPRTGPQRRVRSTGDQATSWTHPRIEGSSRHRPGRRPQLLGCLPFARVYRGGRSRPGNVRSRSRCRLRGLDRQRRRPRGWTGLWRLRPGNGHPRGTGGAGSPRNVGLGPRHHPQRVRLGCTLLPVLEAGSWRTRADSRRRWRSRPRGHPVGSGGGGGGICHGQRSQAGASALARRRARVRQPHDRLRRGDPGSDGRRGRGLGPQQPDERGVHRREPRLPPAGGPVCRDGPARHPHRRRDGGRASGCQLLDSRTGCPQEDGSGVGRESPCEA